MAPRRLCARAAASCEEARGARTTRTVPTALGRQAAGFGPVRRWGLNRGNKQKGQGRRETGASFRSQPKERIKLLLSKIPLGIFRRIDVVEDKLKYEATQTMPRVFCVSDVHTDHKDNMRWIDELCTEEYQNDTLLVGGDVSDDSDRVLRRTLGALKQRFRHVFFVPGNHDLWIKSYETYATSLEKLHSVLDICEELGVQTRPAMVDGIWIVPILSWHHESFDTEPDIEGWSGIPTHREAMMDFKLCRWPESWGEGLHEANVARQMDALNDELCCSTSPYEYTSLPEGAQGVSSWEELVQSCAEAKANGIPVISFSHFLPKLELLPEKRMLFFPNLAKAVGSTFLGERVDHLSPDMHIFGHTHFAWDVEMDNIRYLQAPLAKPAERKMRMKSLSIGAIEFEPLCVWEGTKLCEEQKAHWSDFYKKNERRPEKNEELASWVARLYTRL